MKKKTKKRPKLIPFQNNKGHVIKIEENVTIGQLKEFGVSDFKLVLANEPLRKGWWRSL